MSIGPVELLVLKYRGNRFTGVPAQSIQHLVDLGMIRVIDVMFATKTKDELHVFELQELEDEESRHFEPIVADITGLIKLEDLETLTAGWEPGTSAAVMLFENTWAKRFADDVREAGGEVVLAERVPAAVVEMVARESEGRVEELATS